MNFRLIKLMLLLAVAYWASGMGRFVHEMTEHGGGQNAISPATRVAERGPSWRTAAATLDDDHDDCATCQMLANMSASHAAPPASLISDLALVSSSLLKPQSCFSSHVIGAAPIRGPPSVAQTH